ncbi:protein of unknown function [Hyphomicrobium sp. 1Nfss2.1]|uniref:Bbp19 family protein n=1 Tax=Hyphomicrobium sp. 1Nfss2.1 TaxID=3413936 RepID=UPI003C7B42EA
MNLGADFNLDDLMQNALGGGWDGIENAGKTAALVNKEETRKLREEERRQAAIIAKVFSGKAGRAALQLLVDKTLLRSASLEERNAKTAEHRAMLAERREGQRDVVFMILDMLRVHKGEDPKPTGGEA